ncbi:MAG: hypothetical protein LBU20_01665 [Candidatus Nomurabacteria bacterium]|jgi:opacity protein-like surface antigen|nr:hypothetical protein [Candidatus Nomurabacteria bacterium]
MIKKLRHSVLGTTLAVVLSLFAQPADATDYTITITDASLTHNQSLVFDELNIGPGFNTSYNIRVNNQSSQSVTVGVHDVEEDVTSNLTLNELQLALSYNGSQLVNIGPNNTSGRNFICVGPETDDLFVLNVSMDKNFGNEHQGKSFLVYVTFHGDTNSCQNASPGSITAPENISGAPVPHLPLVPNTGESRALYYFLYGLIAFFSLSTVLLLILFLLRRRADKTKPTSKEDRSP